MLNRRHIRIKVMQSLFAFNGGESDDFSKDEKFLFYSIDSMYDLYLVILSLLVEVQKKAKDRLDKTQDKLLATAEDKNPNRKFADNRLLELISHNEQLKDAVKKRKLNFWDLDFEYVDIIYKAIIESDVYKDYMNDKIADFQSDKAFVVKVYSEIIAPNEKLYEYFEDKRLTWLDDLPVVNTTLVKVFKKLKEHSPESVLLPKLYKDDDDRKFAKDLFVKTLLNKSSFYEEISSKTTNWDAERLASIDGVLLQMALCEFQKFSFIPFKVTMNEYLEIAKEYSTPKSSIFINGVLDKIVKEYMSQNTYVKTGRGLL